MDTHKRIFKYKPASKFIEILIAVAVLGFVSFIVSSGGNNVSALIASLLVSACILYVTFYSHLLTEEIIIDSTSITISRKIGRSSTIPLHQIRRAIIRERVNALGLNENVITLFRRGNHSNKITVSSLDRPFELMIYLERKGKELSFNVIHQNSEGEIIRSLRQEPTDLAH